MPDMTDEMSVVDRTTARVVLLDPDDRVLLLNGFDPTDRSQVWWYTPGGGVEPGETLEQCAFREVAEETGIRELLLGPVVWRRRSEFPFAGRRYRSDEWFHLARTTQTGVDTSGWTELERRSNHGVRWWTVPELRAAGRERMYPAGIGELVARLLAEGPAEEPLRLPDQIEY
jgi:8-oxo-dGTP pyrophosphatase MutT (NUDIX family)